MVIVGAEDEEYRLTIDDIDSSLVFMYTPVTEEGAKGEPQYAMTDFVKAGEFFQEILVHMFLSNLIYVCEKPLCFFIYTFFYSAHDLFMDILVKPTLLDANHCCRR